MLQLRDSFLFKTALVVGIALCSEYALAGDVTEILWDEWGVPHIYAQNEAEMFFGLGWAQMKNHGNLILEIYGRSRGRGAEYWGREFLPSDMLIHQLGFPELARDWWDQQDPEHKQLVASFVRGMNAYAEATPEAFAAKNKVVLPITTTDMNLHTLFVFYTRFVGGRDLGTIRRWGETGSNAYAVGPRRSASGKAMLVQNPHLPWSEEFLFFEAQGVAPGVNIYGVNLVGLPGFGIAFNQHLGWSHTNNTLDNADSYELALRDGGYVLDGQVAPFESRKKTIRIKDQQGQLMDREIEVLRSAHGHVVRRGDDKAVAIRFPALERANSAKQWYAMGKARNLQEFEAALRMQQIPFWNVMYADREGNILYLFNGHVPKRGQGNWQDWDRIVPGGRSADIWTGVHTYEELPRLKNPITGWLQNANDPPWSCTIPMLLKPGDFPSYMAPRSVPNYFRPQRSARMLAEDESITFEELASYKLSTRSEMADRLLDDLLAAIDQHGDDLAQEAKGVLQQWDRQADADSEGALLFANWARRINPYDAANYRTALDARRFLDTPDGFAQPAAVVEQLRLAAKEIKLRWGKLNVPWGQAVRLRVGKYDLPANGADGSLGVFRVAAPQWGIDGSMTVRGGDSWVAVIEFGERVRAKVLLSYGNASQPDSRHYGDQLQLFAKKQLRDAWFYRDDLAGHIVRREVLQDGRFVAVE